MNIDEFQKKLWRAARALPPGDYVPYAFEKRVMARLAAQPVADIWAAWSRTLWRAAVPCVAVMLMLSVWAVVSNGSVSRSETLAADLDRTVWAPLPAIEETW